MPVVRFTCCQHLPKLPTDSLLQDRSSCQFGELFRKHKLVCTGPVWIAGHVAPLNKCRIANSSKLQVTMLSKPNLHVACELDPRLSWENGFDPSTAKQWARMTAAPSEHSFCETDTVLCVRFYVHGWYSAMCERRLLKKWQGDVQPSTDEGSAIPFHMSLKTWSSFLLDPPAPAISLGDRSAVTGRFVLRPGVIGPV